MAAVLTYFKGLRPQAKAGLAFGSCGWVQSGPAAVQEYLSAMKVDSISEPLVARYRPDAGELDACREAGRQLGLVAEKAAK